MSRVQDSIGAAARRPALVLALSPVAALAAAIGLGVDSPGVVIVLAIAAVPLWSLVGLQLWTTSRGIRSARAKLADEHLRFERIFVEAPIGMALTDEQGRWLRVNPTIWLPVEPPAPACAEAA